MANVPRDGEQRPKPLGQGGVPPNESTDALGHRPLRFTKQQIVLAIAIAALSDALCAFVIFMPPLVWTADVVTALLLFAVLGWQWLLLPGLVLEAIPGLGVIPFWLLVVGAILIWGTARPKLK
jgi:hypothetical protein